MNDNLIDKAITVFMYGLLITSIAMIPVMGYAIYVDLTAVTFSLKKDDWTCTRSHRVNYTQLVGKVHMSRTKTVCDTYDRVGSRP